MAPTMPCKTCKKSKNGETRAGRMISKQNLRVSWKPANPRECEWKNLYRIIMRTILQEKETIHCNTIWYTNLFLCLRPWRFPQRVWSGRHASQWNVPDTVEPAIEKSQRNIVLNLICMLAWFKKEWYNRFDYGVPEIRLSNLNPRILLTANPFTVNSDQECFSLFFQFRAFLIEIRCTSHCRLTVYKCKPCQ